MGRQPRVFVAGYPHHVVQRGHDRNAVFVEPADYEYYLANLLEWKDYYDIAIYAYCLMTNHVHLVLAPRADGEHEMLRRALRRNQLIGDGRFVDEIERRTGWRIETRGRGRPAKK